MNNFTQKLFDYLDEAKRYNYSEMLQRQDVDKMVDELLAESEEEINELNDRIYELENEDE